MGSWTTAAILLVALPLTGFGANLPEELTIRMFAKPSGSRLHLLVRAPLKALSGVNLPLRGGNGELDLARTGAMLPSVARWWIADNIEFYENNTRLPMPQVIGTRVSLPSDNSFTSYDEALAHVTRPPLADSTQVVRDQAMLDVAFDYPIRSEASSFALHSGLARLGARVFTELQFLSPSGVRKFEFQGDPGLFRIDPTWVEAVRRFARLGFFQLLKGTDYLLFLFCVALLLGNFQALIPFVAAFSVAHSVTLIASAYDLGSDALWFPALIEALIAISIVYMAFENIAGGVIVRGRWVLASGFGLIYGFGFAFALRPELEFAGSHVLASVLSFNTGIELGQLALFIVLVPVLGLLLRATTARRMETIVLAALAADLGWHRTTERIDRLSQFSFEWPVFNAALIANAMRWLTIFLVLGGLAILAIGVRRHLASRAKPKVTPRGSDQNGGSDPNDATLSYTERPSAL